MNHVAEAQASTDQAFWTQADPQKRHHPGLAASLEIWAKSGQSMQSFSLRDCALSHINLVNPNHKGYDMRDADLYHADLTSAHMFAINLQGANLMKANLSHANLHCANLSDCNLLGAKLDNTKLDNVEWGDKLLQEKQGIAAAREGDIAQAHDYFQQAEETYRNLRLQLEKSGLFETAGEFFFSEMVMRRYQLPRFSSARIISFLVDRFCGYGEKPMRVVGFSMMLIFCCACIYFLSNGVIHNGESLGLHTGNSLLKNLHDFFSCLYFSVVTFTTLGYGDLTPTGIARGMAAIEAFSGSFTMALFVVVFVKKMTR